MANNKKSIKKWFRVKGDEIHSTNYELNENSVVMDLGGYNGTWAKKIISKYNPNVFIIEPVLEFYESIVNSFDGNEKVKVLNVGISSKSEKNQITIRGDESSRRVIKGESVIVDFITIEDILSTWEIDSVDLLQINIEGDEYDILPSMIENGTIKKFKNIQIQFHMNVENFIAKREDIRKGLQLNGFTEKYCFPFVWEAWTIKN